MEVPICIRDIGNLAEVLEKNDLELEFAGSGLVRLQKEGTGYSFTWGTCYGEEDPMFYPDMQGVPLNEIIARVFEMLYSRVIPKERGGN